MAYDKKEPLTYEINLRVHLALWLIRWKRLAAAALVAAVAALAVTVLTFRTPAAQAPAYRQIEAAISQRALAEAQLDAEKRLFADNVLYSMDPEALLRRRLTVSVVLEDGSGITDQLDPTDAVVLAHYNQLRGEFSQEVLVPELMTPSQCAQLLSFGYDTQLNTLSVTILTDDASLADAVLASAAQWIPQQLGAISAATQAHSLHLLPLATVDYTLEEAQSLVSTAAAEEAILALQETIDEANAQLDTAFRKREGWASEQTVPALTARLEQKRLEESRPEILSPLVLGTLLGAALAAFLCSLALLVKGRLPGLTEVASATAWRCLGRLNLLPEGKDPLTRFGWQLLYPGPETAQEALEQNAREMTRLYLQDRSFSGTLALIGNVSPAQMAQAAAVLAPLGYPLETAQLLGGSVEAHRLCRRADAVIFLGSAEDVTLADTGALQEILEPLGKAPLGYLLV